MALLSYIEKARELGEALAQTPEIKALVAAEKAIMADDPAREMFMQYREKEKSVVTAQMLTHVVPEKDAMALLEMKAKLASRNQLIKAYFQALQKYERIMAMVNLMITTAVSGTSSAEELPIPDELKNIASQLMDPKQAAKIMQSSKPPEGIKLPPGMKPPGMPK
ncbi:MAG: YlbF family regulator [Peptococcaceae bacterium]|nr:YlbF family regulator [Peptococcaceae bacterium]